MFRAMFRKLRGKSEYPVDANTSYLVRYLGSVEDICSTEEDIERHVQTLVQMKREIKRLPRMSLTIAGRNLELRDLANPKATLVFVLSRITFTNTPGEDVFAFSYQLSEDGDRMECHAVLCVERKGAKVMAAEIARALEKKEKTRRTRDKTHDKREPPT